VLARQAGDVVFTEAASFEAAIFDIESKLFFELIF
jgi:hypothetical protein